MAAPRKFSVELKERATRMSSGRVEPGVHEDGRGVAGPDHHAHRVGVERYVDGLRARSRAGQDVAGLVHHSDRGVQYRAIRYTERLADAEAVTSVGSMGNSFDNAMAEAFNSLFKAERIRNPVMRPRGGWGGVGEVEIAVAEYIDWFNHRRLHGETGHVPPVEHETAYHADPVNCWATAAFNRAWASRPPDAPPRGPAL